MELDIKEKSGNVRNFWLINKDIRNKGWSEMIKISYMGRKLNWHVKVPIKSNIEEQMKLAAEVSEFLNENRWPYDDLSMKY